MEKTLELKGIPGIAALILLIVVGGYFFGFDRMFGRDYELKGVEFDRAMEAVYPEIQYHYQQNFLAPLQEQMMDGLRKGAGDQASADELVTIAGAISSLKIEKIISDKYSNVKVIYSMDPATPDGVTEREYRLDKSSLPWRVMY